MNNNQIADGLYIRKGADKDIPYVAGIYEKILDRQDEGTATVGWIRGVYPTEATARAALSAGELFVMVDENCPEGSRHNAGNKADDSNSGRIVAAARINQIQVPEYANASWRYSEVSPEQVMVLHTLVVDPECAGKGYGTEFVRFYEQYAFEHGCPYLRMDTNARNKAARKLYAKLGFWEADIVPCVFNGIPDVQLVCLEKSLINNGR